MSLARGRDPHDYAQEKDGWCGHAALSWALGEQGVEKSQEDIAFAMGDTSTQGVDPGKLEETAKEYGMSVHTISERDPEKTLSLLDNYKDLGWSVILDYLAGDSMKEDGHYVVLLDVISKGIRVFNPSDGGNEETRDKASFISHWKDTTKSGKVFHNYALLLKKI